MDVFQTSEIYLEHLILASAADVTVGMCLKMGTGGLVECGAAEKPEYIANADAVGDGVMTIPVRRVTDDTVLAAELAADYAALEIGAKLKLSTDASRLAAETGGAMQVIGYDGKSAGDRVLCRAVESDAV